MASWSKIYSDFNLKDLQLTPVRLARRWQDNEQRFCDACGSFSAWLDGLSLGGPEVVEIFVNSWVPCFFLRNRNIHNIHLVNIIYLRFTLWTVLDHICVYNVYTAIYVLCCQVLFPVFCRQGKCSALPRCSNRPIGAFGISEKVASVQRISCLSTQPQGLWC